MYSFALGPDKNKLFVGGSSRGGGVVSALNLVTGAKDETFPSLHGRVYGLEISADGKKLYVGGKITKTTGEPQVGLVVVDLESGAIAEPKFSIMGKTKDIEWLGDGNTLIVGGQYIFKNLFF